MAVETRDRSRTNFRLAVLSTHPSTEWLLKPYCRNIGSLGIQTFNPSLDGMAVETPNNLYDLYHIGNLSTHPSTEWLLKLRPHLCLQQLTILSTHPSTEWLLKPLAV